VKKALKQLIERLEKKANETKRMSKKDKDMNLQDWVAGLEYGIKKIKELIK